MEQRELDLVEGVRRRERRMVKLYTFFQVIGYVGGAVLLPTWVYVSIRANSHLSTLDFFGYLFMASFVIVMVSIVGMAWLSRWGLADIAKRQQRVLETVARLLKLKKEHPELLVLNEVSELLEADKAEAEGQRSFWVGIAVNMFFTLLGFALSYAATKLGWLP